MLDPIVYQRPCVSSKVAELLSKEEVVPRGKNEDLGNFIEQLMLFDSVLVFIICYFSRICCVGALFLRKTKPASNSDSPLLECLQNILEKKQVLECEINVLYPVLQKNFDNFDPQQVRLSYVATLLFVRNYIKRKTLKFVTAQLDQELVMNTACQELNVMGNEAFKKEQYKDAIELYASALSKNPYSYIILSNRAQAYKKLGKYKESQLDSYMAVAINPTWCLGYCKLSSSLYVQQLYDEAYKVAEYGLSKCKGIQSKDYETLESIKMEATFKRSHPETSKESTSEPSSPKENGQNCSAPKQKELEKETKISEQVASVSDGAASKKENGIDISRKSKIDSPPKQNLKLQISPQKDVPPLIEAPESDDSYSEDVPQLIEAPESDDSSYYEDEADLDPSYEEMYEEVTVDSNASQHEEECDFEQKLQQPYLGEVPNASGVTNCSRGITDPSPTQIQDKACGTSDELLERVEKQMSILTESINSKLAYVESSFIPYAEPTSSISRVTNTSESSSQKSSNSCATSHELAPDKKIADTYKREKSNNAKCAEKEIAVTNGIKNKNPKIVDIKEERPKTVDIKEERPKTVESKEIKPDIDAKGKNGKKSDGALKPAQAQNLTSVKKNLKSSKNIDDTDEDIVAKVYALLKGASEDLANGCGYLACRYFQNALSQIKESPEVYGFQESEIVCIKYVYAKALCMSGEYSDLLKGIDTLQEIIKEHENISFPTAYYGLALAFSKLNRFKESLSYSKILQEILNKGIRLKVYPYPGLTLPIPETKAEILKTLIKDLIEECENPPKPAAICRHLNCSNPPIHYSDPDFKGFICIFCSDQCCLQYHVTCWKTMKTDLSFSDKDFLCKNCFTPDCAGLITQVKNIDKDGNTGKVFTTCEFKKPQKMKKSKLEKRIDLKEEKKKRRRHSRCDSVSSVSEAPSHEDLNPSSSSSKLSQCETESEFSSSTLAADLEIPEAVSKSSAAMNENGNGARSRKTSCTKNEKSNDVLKTSPISPSATSGDGNDPATAETRTTANECHSEIEGSPTKMAGKFLTPKSTLSVDADPFYGGKLHTSPSTNKNAETIMTKPKPVTKAKGKILKWKSAGTAHKRESQRQHSEPFWSTNETEDFPALPAPENSLHYSAECQSFHDIVSTPPDTYLPEMVDQNIFSYLEEFLNFHGPLKIDDPILVEALSEFPIEANIRIADCGGISEFLKKNISFAVVGESYICVVKDVVSAYNLFRHGSLPEDSDCHDLLNNVCEFSSGEAKNNSNFPTNLNPDALEYSPSFSGGVDSNNHAQKGASSQMSEHNSESIISVFNRLRQPLCVDEDNVVKTSNCDNVAKVDSWRFSWENSKTEYSTFSEGGVVTDCVDESVIPFTADVVVEDAVANRTIEEESVPSEELEEKIMEGALANSEEIVQEKISEEKNSERSFPEGAIHEKSSERTAQSSEGTLQERIPTRAVEEKISDKVIRDHFIKALNVPDERARISDGPKEEKVLTEVMNNHDEEVANVCDEASETEALCNAMQNSEICFWNQSVGKKSQDCAAIAQTVARACQTENNQQALMVSKGTMKTDESVDRMKEIISWLQEKERVANEEVVKKTAENEKLLKEIRSFQKSLTVLKEEKADVDKICREMFEELENISKNVQSVEEKVRVSEKHQAEVTKNVLETNEKHKKMIEELNALRNMELSLRTESQATFQHLNELVASLSNEKLEAIKRAEKAELNVLQLEKAQVLNKINSKITEAEQKVKQLKEGISLVPLDPVGTKSMEALMYQIENCYVKDLCAIRDDFEVKMGKHIKEVESGTPLEKLKIDEVKDLPEIPQLSSQVLIPNSTFKPSSTWPTESASVDPTYLKVASTFPSLAIAPALNSVGATNSIASVPIAPNVSISFAATAAAIPDTAAVSVSTFKKLPPGINNSFASRLTNVPSRSVVSDPVQERNQRAQLNEMSGKESAKVISTNSLSSSSSTEGKTAAKSSGSLELGYSSNGFVFKPPSSSQGKNSYEKLLLRLMDKFPTYTQVQLMSYIREFREKRQGKLSGLTLDSIVTQVGALIQSKQSASRIDLSKVPEVITKSRPAPNKLSAKRLVTEIKSKEQPIEAAPVKKGNPWGDSSDASKKWSGDALEECAICCEEFISDKAAYKVDCGHRFHLECIREWLNKKSDCPICRVHLLLPEDYPSLS